MYSHNLTETTDHSRSAKQIIPPQIHTNKQANQCFDSITKSKIYLQIAYVLVVSVYLAGI